MSKTKYYLMGSILVLAIIGGIIFLTKSVEAETTSTTFPVDEAGIAAYVKLDSVEITDLTEALNFYSSIEKQDETYVIGTVKVPNLRWDNFPHVYIGLDGWIVAYYLKTEEASRIMQWKGYEKGTIKTTTLQDAIDIMCANIEVAYSSDIKYYDFEFPDANKMTLIAETLPTFNTNDGFNSFSVTVPGILYEGSYSIYSVWWGYNPTEIGLKVDRQVIFSRYDRSGLPNQVFYGYYDPSTHLEVNEPHFITFYKTRFCNGDGAATILIYKSQ